MLFVGAHPDDEAGRLSSYGQWNEDDDVRTGVVTITRGEGGGNAVGPEEGPALGLIREAEERRAVGLAGITDVYNLDKVDFYYTVSAPLTEQVWGKDDTLARLVRVVRQTRPEVIVTMDPAPSPGNHGNHQYAGRMAFEAYQDAGDPSAFAGQLSQEGLRAWSPDKLLLQTSRGSATATGPACATSFQRERPTQNVYGVWGGRASQRHGTTWAAVERRAQREYASQGWSVFPDVSSDPSRLGCDYFTQVEARVPFVPGDLTAASADPTTVLQGAVLPTPGGFPLGTGLEVTPGDFDITPGSSTTLEVTLTAPARTKLKRVRISPSLPEGWTSSGSVLVKKVMPGETTTRSIEITAPAGAATNERVRAAVRLTSKEGWRGYGDTELEVAPPVDGRQELLPQVADFQRWAAAEGYRQMEGFVKPVLTLPSGGTRDVTVTLTNNGDTTASGSTRMELPAGFSATPASRDYSGLAAGASTDVTFSVTNTDTSLQTGMQGGDYDYDLVTTGGGVTATETPALELVPATTVGEAPAAPTVDGTVDDGEYPGEALDLSRRWEGAECESAADCSATGRVTRSGDDLYVAVEVTDDAKGTALDAADCKRHWRTDAVEIAFDPDGTSENTSTTFKAFVMPRTAEGGPCYGRDADNRQGPGEETAPGMEVASQETATGYVIEARIPATELPSTVDPERLGMNLFVYDSDTQDRTGQTRIGWSTWGGVQGDPYRWGVVRLPGWTPPQVPAKEPVIPSEALSSLDSPQSIAQAARTGVPLAGGPAAAEADAARVMVAQRIRNGVTVTVEAAGPGTAHLFAVDADGATVGRLTRSLEPGVRRLKFATTRAPARVLLGWEADAGGTTSSAVPVG